jgi:hypothetical protein
MVDLLDRHQSLVVMVCVRAGVVLLDNRPWPQIQAVFVERDKLLLKYNCAVAVPVNPYRTAPKFTVVGVPFPLRLLA